LAGGEKLIAKSGDDADNVLVMEVLKPTRPEWKSFPKMVGIDYP
jgi:hypothetical protein